MIRIASQPKSATPAWHAGFLAMLPVIHAYARGAFAHLNPEARQDLIQEVIATGAHRRHNTRGHGALRRLAGDLRFTAPGRAAIARLGRESQF